MVPTCAACRDPEAVEVQRGAAGRWLCEECRGIALALVVLAVIDPDPVDVSGDPTLEPRTREA